VNTLGTPEGPVAGTLANNGLGAEEWTGATRANAEMLIRQLPSVLRSPVQRTLLRKLLLTPAPPPDGESTESFNGLRIRTLLNAGLVDDAADLAVQVNAPAFPDAARAQADALLFAGRDNEACGDATAYRLQSGEPFWVELRAFCYALTGDTEALELTRSVMDAQGIDPEFPTLLNAMTTPVAKANPKANAKANAKAKPQAAVPFGEANALKLRLLEKLKLSIPAEVAATGDLPTLLLIARSENATSSMRIAAAKKLFQAGVLPDALFQQILDLYSFKPGELAGADALARSEGTFDGIARLNAALKNQTKNAQRADLLHTAFAIGERDGLLPQIAHLFGESAAALQPSSDWSNWASLMGRALMLDGKYDAAQRWYAALNPANPLDTARINRLQLALGLAAPNDIRTAQSQGALSWMAVQATASDPSAVAEAVLNVGLYDALGRKMPPDAEAAVSALMALPSAGRRPESALMKRIDQAALDGQRGILVLSVMDAIGQDPDDLAPDVVVRLVRALATGGANDAARALAVEAVLTQRLEGASG
jgi:hypothetical protein